MWRMVVGHLKDDVDQWEPGVISEIKGNSDEG